MQSNHFVMKGQALIALLSFIIISITIISAAVIILITNTLGSSKVERGVTAYALAQSGTENALLRLLRNPSYTNEVIATVDGTITISVQGTPPAGPFTIYSTGKAGNFVRRVRATATYVNSKLILTEWKEL